MKYSYEYKVMSIEIYRQGKWPETVKGDKEKPFHNTIRKRVRIEEACGTEALRHKEQNKVWTPDEKYELVANEKFYGYEKEYTSFEKFKEAVAEYIAYYNNERIQKKTKWMPPAKFREASIECA